VIETDKLRTMPLFNVLPEDDREAIAEFIEEVDVPSGTRLVTEGEEAYSFFVVQHGSAEVSADGERIGQLGPGDFFGEVGLMLTGRRTATVTAQSAMVLVALRDSDFHTVERRHPEIAERLRAAVKERFPIRAH
jgi:CRP-like cAMP-binding protein